MLRAVLVGLLCVSTFGCKGAKDEVSAAQTGPAGSVVDVTGNVTVAGKPLSKGATVAADDVVDTGSDGHVVIELAHNNARWDLGPGKHEKVSASLAWTLAKNEGTAKPVDQDTSAAGRPAERSAADTAVTAVTTVTTEEKKQESAPRAAVTATPPPAETGAARADTAKAPAPSPAVTGGARAASAESPTPPPPAIAAPAQVAPPPPPAAQPVAPGAIGGQNMPAPKGAAPHGDAIDGRLDQPSGGGRVAVPQKKSPPPAPPKKAIVPADDYLKCLTGITALHLVLHGHADGKTTYQVQGGTKLPASAKACVDKVTAGIKLDDGAHADIDVTK